MELLGHPTDHPAKGLARVPGASLCYSLVEQEPGGTLDETRGTLLRAFPFFFFFLSFQ